MSYITWHYYGFGICTDAIQTKDVERLQALLAKAPELEKEIQKWLTECGIEDPVWDDYMEYDQDYSLGLATIMKEVILEAEGIEMTACDSYDAGRDRSAGTIGGGYRKAETADRCRVCRAGISTGLTFAACGRRT